MKYRIGVARFPGSNCEQDCLHALSLFDRCEPLPLWHREAVPDDIAAVILPGGFTHGDYLRPGALAAASPLMDDLLRLIGNGLPVVGICNGFQILAEAGVLPGALLPNSSGRFVCRDSYLLHSSPTALLPGSQGVLKLPVAHRSGRYFIDRDGLRRLQDEGRIILQYCDRSGGVYREVSPNGSVVNIAAVANSSGTVLGMMPHPERAVERLPSGRDGKVVFSGLLDFLDSCSSQIR